MCLFANLRTNKVRRLKRIPNLQNQKNPHHHFPLFLQNLKAMRCPMLCKERDGKGLRGSSGFIQGGIQPREFYFMASPPRQSCNTAADNNYPKKWMPSSGEAVTPWHKVSGSSTVPGGTPSPLLLSGAVCITSAAPPAGFQTAWEAGVDAKATVLCLAG